MQSLTASMEDYLETIFRVIEEKEAVRPKDIAGRMKVSNASVTGALRSLSEKGLIRYVPYDVITLTTEGRALARDVSRRHEVLRDFFVRVLAVDEADADEGACRMEHAIPKSILDRLVQFAEFVQVCPRGGSDWISGFGHYCNAGEAREQCDRCLSDVLKDLRRRQDISKGKSSVTTLLDDLEPGQRGKVLKIKARGDDKKRIGDMSIVPGTVVEMVRSGGPDDDIEIKVKGYHYSLRKSDVHGVSVEILE